MLIVPLPPVVGGTFSQRTKLGERDYILRYRHNSRVDSWTLDVESLQEGGEPLPVQTGAKLFCGHDLLRRCYSADVPPGSLVVMRFDGTRRNPNGADIGECKLVYFEPGEEIGAS